MTGSILTWVGVGAFVLVMGYVCVRLIEKLIEKKIEKFKSEIFVIDEEAEAASKDPEKGDLLWDESKDWVESSREKAGWR
jgi:hypothetical protein